MQCQICKAVGIRRDELEEADAIAGNGCETMCVDCAWNLLEATPASIEDAREALATAERRRHEFPFGGRIARKLREAAFKAYPELREEVCDGR